jgi:hypothetical protein
MDPTSAALPILRIQQLPGYQSGGQQQAPFAQGQLLQGVISARTGTGQFTIDIGGRQLLAESATPLAVGARLDLQVTALVPRVELQIVHNPVQRMIGATIHLIGQQATTLPALTGLADQAAHLPGLSTASRETLEYFAAVSGRTVPAAGTPDQALGGLLGRTAALFTSAPGGERTALLAEIGTRLSQLARGGTLTPDSAARATALASLFTDLAARPGAGQALLPAGIDPAALAALAATAETGSAQRLAASLLPLLANTGATGSTPLGQLVALLAELESAGVAAAPRPVVDGNQLHEVIDRLGVNLERLFAEGRQEEAVRTLKFALLELAQQLPAGERGTMQADQLVRSIELFQLLQIRLAGESLFFLPLPFSFLDQGYLLVDADQGRDQDRQGDEQAHPRYELHLRLEGLGNLQISVHKADGRLAVRFLAEDSERARFLADHRGELEQRLSTEAPASVQFLVGAREPVGSLLERIVRGVTGMVDTRA